MRILFISNMYPYKNNQNGIFVQKQEIELLRTGLNIQRRVLFNRSVINYLLFYWGCFWDIITKKFDIIHAHYGFHSAIIPAILPTKPLVITFHGSDALIEPKKNFIYNFLQKYVIKKADHIIAVSDDIRENIVANLKGSPDKISVISCGIDTNIFKPQSKKQVRQTLGLNPDEKIVLFVGKVIYEKGIDIIKVLSNKLPDISFYLAGAGDYHLGKSKNVKKLGIVDNDLLPLWYNASDLFILPSRSEGTPVVLLEAMSCGIPLISSSVGGCCDLVIHKVNGFLFNVEDVINSSDCIDNNYDSGFIDGCKVFEELANHISQIMNDKNLQNLMGKYSREKAIINYDQRVIADRIHKVYQDIHKSPSRRF